MTALTSSKPPAVTWPQGKRFAFPVFDDPDSQTLEAGRAGYSFLADQGFLTTKGVWPVRGPRTPSGHGGTCAEPDYLAWCVDLQRQGFEIGLHNATLHTSLSGRNPCCDQSFHRNLWRPAPHHGPSLLL